VWEVQEGEALLGLAERSGASLAVKRSEQPLYLITGIKSSNADESANFGDDRSIRAVSPAPR